MFSLGFYYSFTGHASLPSGVIVTTCESNTFAFPPFKRHDSLTASLFLQYIYIAFSLTLETCLVFITFLTAVELMCFLFRGLQAHII